MYGDDDPGGRRRVGAAAATLAVHAALAAVLIWGLAERGAPPRPDGGLTTVDLSDPPPPPPPPPPPSPQPSHAAAKNAPAPQGKKAEAAPREAPQVALPFPIPAPAARAAGDGAAASAGAGAAGTGPGAGGGGSGSGGGGDGGLGSPAVRIAGALRNSDYPREAEAQGLAGTVAISFRVRSDGGVDQCRVVRSSGAALLDDLTCRLFTQRFRFRPATDAAGRPVDSTLSTSFTWGIRPRR